MRPRMQGLRHIALYVSDVERSLEFYRDVMGMEVEWRPDTENVYLTTGTDNLALHQRSIEPSASAPAILDHIGFVVPAAEDVDDWARYLERQGVGLSMAPRTHRDGARSIYFEDPDGIRIQLIHHPPISEG